MTTLAFEALDYRADQSFVAARYRYRGDEHQGWTVERDGRVVLELGPGYRLLRTEQCGVCSTDLARHALPFPLPQVIGHEVVARDAAGRRVVVEINASHAARGVEECALCRAGLATHCPERLVLGIHALPGGFGPWMLAPVGACIEVPEAVPDSAAVLVEPFAAALHAVRTTVPRDGERIAVLGPRRLGMLLVAALASERARRRERGEDFAIVALARDPALLPLARSLGATEGHVVEGDGSALADGAFDVVFDTTGNPEALPLALRLARREVHLKSTHGRASAGLAHATELVVDELSIEPFEREEDETETPARVAWLASAAPPAGLDGTASVRRGAAAALAEHYEGQGGLPRADVAVVDSAAQVDLVIRPRAGREEPLVRPRGAIRVHPGADRDSSPLLAAVVERGLRLASSRCGDFGEALAWLAGDAELCRLGERLVTHRFDARELARAFTTARSRDCIKAVVTHPRE